MFNQTKAMKERTIEAHLRYYNSYIIGIKNCEQQLNYIMPSLVTKYGYDANGAFFFICNDTEKVALDRIEGRRALNLKEEIEQNKIITTSIENALEDLHVQEHDFVKYRYFECLSMHEVKVKLGYSHEKSVYRIRKRVLDKLMISLSNLLTFK